MLNTEAKVFNLTGLHVALTMFTGYLVGYAAFRALFSHNPVMVSSNRPCYLFIFIKIFIFVLFI